MYHWLHGSDLGICVDTLDPLEILGDVLHKFKEYLVSEQGMGVLSQFTWLIRAIVHITIRIIRY